MKIDEIQIYNDVYSPLKAAYHMSDIKRIRYGEIIPPKFLMLHPEAFCNNMCSFCAYRYSGWNKVGMKFATSDWVKNDLKVLQNRQRPVGQLIPEKSGLPKQVALALPKQMHEEGIPAIEITGSGEPTLYPHIQQLFRLLAKYDRETALVTHGQNLGPLLDNEVISNLQWIRFSMDSCTAETHNKVHGVSKALFNLALKNISRVVEMYPKSIVGISFIITKDNWQEIAKSAEFYKKMGVSSIRYSFEYEPSGTANIEPKLIPVIRELINAAKGFANKNFKVFGQVERLENYNKPNTDFTFCGYQLFTYNIGYNAKVYPCCIQLYYPNYDFGDLTKESLHEVIYGKKHKEYIEKFDVKACNNCWLRDKNIALETLISPDKRLGHINFV